MKRFIYSILAIFIFTNISAQTYSYVTQNGAGNQDGSSWANAYSASDIQTAIDYVNTAGSGEVWLAAGTYYPTTTFDNSTGDNRKKSITLKSNVHIYGGFSGNETAKSQRTDFGEGEINETILSGDIGTAAVITDNSYHVVYVELYATNTLIDGFTIQDGNANSTSNEEDGGGIFTYYGSLQVNNCVIKNNNADDEGGGLFINENFLMQNSIIHSNTSVYGGGVYVKYSASWVDSVQRIENCKIVNNDCSSRGGGVYLSNGGSISNSIIANNEANFYGGGVRLEYGGQIINSTIASNHANTGEGVHRNRGNGIVQNSVIWNNDFYSQGSDTAIEYSAVEGGYTGSMAGSGIINLSASNSGTATANYAEFINPTTSQGYNASMSAQYLAADWRVNCNSAIIDTANSSLVPSGITNDIDGNLRSIDGNGDGTAKPDLGAYEYSSTYNVSQTICQGDTFAFGNMNLTNAGNYQNTLNTSNGCDSNVNLSLTVLPADSGFVNAQICEGSSFAYGGQTYNQSGVYYQTAANPNACDSIIKISVNVNPIDTTLLSDTNIYENQNFTFFGQSITTSGVYYHSLTSINNCDSVIKQNITYTTVDTIISDVLCSGGTYNFEGNILYSAGTYFTTIQSANNNDSAIQLNLSVLPVDTTVLDSIYINQGSNYNFHGTNISSAGIYYHTLNSTLGCDSVLKLKVLTRRYVSQSGSGSKTGYNWANAYDASDLQTAINDISIAGGGQVWVANGTYKRTSGSSRSLSFTIYDDVELYGGFAGNETDISQRSNFGFNQTYETELSGDIGIPNDTSDNTYTIIKQSSTAEYCVIDGFTIRDACNSPSFNEGGGVFLREGGILRNSTVYNNYAEYKAGGVYNDGGKIYNCLIKENRTDGYAGGVLMRSGEIVNSTIYGNITDDGGGGIQFMFDNGIIDSCVFEANYTYEYGWGGALSLAAGVDTILISNSTFTNNHSTIGGAFYTSSNTSEIIVDNCVFENNYVDDYLAQATNTTYDGVGGAAFLSVGIIKNSIFKNNSATKGGAIEVLSNATVDNCEFKSNSANDVGGAVYFYQAGQVLNSKITDNSAVDGGGIYFDAGGYVENTLIDSNYASGDGGGLFFNGGGELLNSQVIANNGDDGAGMYIVNFGTVNECEIHSNSALYDGGGIYNVSNDNPILNSEIYNNYARYNGGGIYQDISNNGNGLVVNSNIFNNQARYDGGGVYFYFGGKLINCNINRNIAEDQGGGVYINYKAKIKNSVIWGNDSLQIYLSGTNSYTEIDSTAVMAGYSGYGAGNLIINLDSLNTGSASLNYPKYLNPTSFIGNINSYPDSLQLMSSDWNLNCGSALIDKGDNNILPDTITKDLRGNDRINDGDNDNNIDVDLGPIEAIYSYEIDVLLCENDTFYLGNQAITQAGTYSSSLTSSNSCDSNVTVNITISPIDSVQVFETICANQNYNFNGQNLSSSGVYTSTFASTNGCDSIVELNLTVLNIDSSVIQQSICEGSNFVFNGTVYNQSGTYYDTLVSANSCDSIIKIEITVNQVDTTTQYQTICEGNSYGFYGNNLSTSGIYYHSLTSTNSCDSIIELDLTVNQVDTSIVDENICSGSSYNFFGINLNQSGTYYHTTTASNLCDSVIQLNLNINQIDTTQLNESICEGSLYNFYGSQLSVAGTYYHTLSSQYQCDSVIELNLIINQIDTTEIFADFCENSTYNFYGNSLSGSGIYYHTLSNQNACDSVIKLNLNELQIDTTINNQSICEGSSYNFFGNNISTSGIYYHTLNAVNSCDSVIELHFTVNSIDTTIINEYICNNTSYNFFGNNLTTAGTYYHTLTASTLCDSIVQLNLNFNAVDSNFIYQSICQGDSVFFAGNYINQSGLYYQNLTNQNACDSIVIFDLSVLNHSQSTINVSSCESYTSPSGNYIWNTSGTYYDTISNSIGCDSVITINVNILNSTTSVINPAVCESFTSPSGNYIWTNSGTYYDTIQNTAGCDSVITINLTVHGSTYSNLSINACDSYTSPSGNFIWNNSGTYTDTISNNNGCDSIMTINLTIGNSTSSIINPNACRYYTSPSGNYTWTTSGTYYDTIPNSFGCDSVITINLNIHNIDTTITYISPSLISNETGAAQYQWIDCDNSSLISGAISNSFTPDSNGNYAVIITGYYCIDTSECYSVTDVGFDENSFNNLLKVYPNPVKEELIIEYDSEIEAEFILYSSEGKILRKGELQRRFRINTSEFTKAVYILQIISKDEVKNIRIVKQ